MQVSISIFIRFVAIVSKALVSAAQLSGAQSARSLCLSASGAQKLINEWHSETDR